jgi:tRNA A-37 threonylcarbamoyl transferase component Bud32
VESAAVCPNCQKSLSAGAPEGLCPECLIKSGLETATDGDRSQPGQRFVPPAAEEIRPLFPQLEILELVGRGGMGAVYKARQPSLDRHVALKILSAGGDGAGFEDRFIREARALARLNHPHIVTVHDFGVAGTLHYLIMEYVDGPNLRQVQRSGQLTPDVALRLVPEICGALQFAHSQGVVHRDIKPENLLLDREGRVKITDFGIAKMLGGAGDAVGLTGAMDVVGTPHYMAPEQIEKPSSVDHRADIYSLGVVFYEMLTGELPLGKFAPPSSRVQVDVRLDEVVLRTLEKEPDRRYQQAAEVKTRVEAIAASPGHTAFTPSAQRITIVPTLIFYALQASLAVPAEATFFRGDMIGAAIWTAAAVCALIVTCLLFGLMHHACWSALPPRYRATTPARAIGFLFIPFFNLYWAFVTFIRLADGFNALRAEHPDWPLKNMRGWAEAKAVLFACYWTLAFVPGFVSLVCLTDFVIFVVFYRGIVHNTNTVIERSRLG